MITITRCQVRGLRAIFRRHVLGISHRGSIPPLVFRAENTQLRAQYRYAALAIEHVEDGNFRPTETIALPLDALSDIEGRDDTPVIVEAIQPDATVVRWQDHGIPQTREYTVPTLESLAAFPEPPEKFETAPAELLDALAEAARTCPESSTRYTLECIQLRGNTREIVATDGHQLLIQGGIALPWNGELMVKHTLAFGCKELPRDRPVSIGRTETHVVIKGGPWTLFLEIQTDGRYPNVDHILPDEVSSVARLQLNPEDAAFLLSALDSLPGADQENSPATIDLNGRVAIRARGTDAERPTELVLSRSGYSGTPIRFSTNREFVGRAIRLGFTEFMVTDADSPIVCRDSRRAYGWQTLNKDSAIEPSDDVTRIESAPATTHPTPRLEALPKVRTPVSDSIQPAETATRNHVTPKVSTVLQSTGTAGLAALIQEAETVHEALSAAKARTKRLVVALRKHRRHERLVATTLASLKELRLQEVAG
jgi:hypothetical protein